MATQTMLFQKRSHGFVVSGLVRHKRLLADCVLSKDDLRSTGKAQGHRQQKRRFHRCVAGIRFRGEGMTRLFPSTGPCQPRRRCRKATHLLLIVSRGRTNEVRAGHLAARETCSWGACVPVGPCLPHFSSPIFFGGITGGLSCVPGLLQVLHEDSSRSHGIGNMLAMENYCKTS